MKMKWNSLAMAGALLLGQVAFMGQAQTVSAAPMCLVGGKLQACSVTNFQPMAKTGGGSIDPWAESIKGILDKIKPGVDSEPGMGTSWHNETNHSIYTFKADGQIDSIVSSLDIESLFARSDFNPINIIDAGSDISFSAPVNSKHGVITIGNLLQDYIPQVGDFFYSAALQQALSWFNTNSAHGATLTIEQKYSQGATFAIYASLNPLLGVVNVVPEPSTLLLFGVGLAGLARTCRRRQ